MKRIILILLTMLNLTSTAWSQVPNYVPTTGLVGWWPFNGNANDESGNGYTYSGAINLFTNDRFGTSNAAIDLTNQTNVITTNYNGIMGQNPRTVNLWFKVLSAAGNNPDFFAYGGSLGAGWNMLLINSHLTIDNSNSQIQYNPTATLNIWHMFTVTYHVSFGTNTLACKIYLDGIQITTIFSNFNGSQTLNTGPGNPVLFAIGGPSNAIMDDVGMWNRVLTQCEINDLFFSGPSASNINSSICQGDSVQINGNYYSSPGLFYDSLSTVLGCDSLLNINITELPVENINNPITICQGELYNVGTSTYSVQGNYSDTLLAFNGCDSIINTSLTVNSNSTFNYNPSICPGGSVSVGLNTYTIAGNYSDTLIAANGCDSIISTNLSIIDCSGIQNNLDLKLSVFPNPSNGIVNFIPSSDKSQIVIDIYNTYGQKVYSTEKLITPNNQITLDISELSNGIYYLVIDRSRSLIIKQ